MPEKDKNDKSEGPGTSRIQKLKDELDDEFYEPEMPPLDDSAYLVDYLWMVGPVMSSGMGSGPITHGELQAFQFNTGIELSEWESSSLRQLSIDYLNESSNATKIDCPAPWGDAAAVKANQDVLIARIKANF